MTSFCTDMEAFSKYSPVTSHLSPATRSLTDDPVSHKKNELYIHCTNQ